MPSPISRCRQLVAVLALFGALTPACAAPAALTLAEAQDIAILRSRQLVGIDASISAAREMAVAAGQRPDPVLKLGVDNLPLSGPDRFSLGGDFMTMRRLGVMQELTGADKRHWRAEGYARAADKSAAEKAAAGAAIRSQTAVAWFDRLYAGRMAQLAAEQQAEARIAIDAAEASYRAGRASQADVLAARGELALADDRASETARRERTAAINLTRWVGSEAERPLAAPPAIDVLGLDPARLAAQSAQHPQIAVLAREEARAQAQVQLAQADKKPDWSVEVALQQRGSAYANMISVGLSVPLQWDRKDRQQREVSAKLAMVEQARAEREEAEREHAAEIRTMAEEWDSARERIARYERELLPLAASRTQALLAAYNGGKASLADLLAGRRNETALRVQMLQLQMDSARIWAQLNFLFSHPDTTHTSP